MGRRTLSFTAIAILAACGTHDRVSDPIQGVPQARQRTISRAQYGFRWPLTPGRGTLACAESGVILFRAGGVTYVVQGQRRGASDIAPLRIPEPSAPPSNPLKRMTQDARMEAFAALRRCSAADTDDACSRTARARFGLSIEDARLIEAEGRERRGPPLTRGVMSLDALVDAGRALCAR